MSLPSPMTSGCVLVARVAAAQHVAEADHLAVGVRHLDADGRLARDRREQPDVVGGHGVGDVAVQRGDLLDLDAGAELDLVAGDGRASGEAGDRGVDVELLEDAGDRLDDPVVRAAARARGRSGGQQITRRERVGRVAGGLAHRQAQLLADTVAARLGRRGGRHGRSGAAGPRGWFLGGRVRVRRWLGGIGRRLGEGGLPAAERAGHMDRIAPGVHRRATGERVVVADVGELRQGEAQGRLHPLERPPVRPRQ